MAQAFSTSGDETRPAALVVVGASTGGVAALSRLVAELPADLPAAVLIVLHIGSHPSTLPTILGARSRLPTCHAEDGMALRPGQLYVAPPDRHMLVMDGHIRLTRGPKEHFTRPAIDPLFLAAALAWGPAVVGVILTGSLEDGTVGLKAVKACGGATVVQDPANAEAPSMPASALKYVEVDYCGPIGGLGSAVVSLLDRQASKSSTPRAPLPPSLIHEQDIALSKGDPIEHLDAIARPSTFTCPDCHGSLWQLNEGRPVRYRCHTGHAYTLETLQRTLLQSTDEALWGALRALQEQALVLDMLAQAHRADGNEHDARRVEQTRDAMARQADTLRLLVERQPDAVL